MSKETLPGAVGARLESGVGRLYPERAEDAISRSKRILEMVDTYVDRPDKMNRTALRVALMNEFEDSLAQGRAGQVDPVFDWKPKDAGCWCARCDMEHNVMRTRMSVCDKCGDKRCPRAEDHRDECREPPNV